MDPDSLRRSTRHRRTVAGAATLIAIAAVGIVWLVGGDEPRPTSAAVPATAPVIEQPRLALALPSAASEAAIEMRLESPGEVQMCGGAWIELKEDGEVDWKSVEAVSPAEAFMTGALEAMASGADERARAAALATMARAGRERPRLADTLAKLAQTSDDPVVYGWAVQACSVAAPEVTGFCQVISPAQWARLDPANAAPWISVAARAQAENDTAAFEDALYRIGSAERYEPDYKLASVLLDHVPAGEANLWGAFNLAVSGSGASAGFAASEGGLPLHSCRAQDLTQGGRRETCSRIAEMLVKASTTHHGLTVGSAIGSGSDARGTSGATRRESQALQSGSFGTASAPIRVRSPAIPAIPSRPHSRVRGCTARSPSCAKASPAAGQAGERVAGRSGRERGRAPR